MEPQTVDTNLNTNRYHLKTIAWSFRRLALVLFGFFAVLPLTHGGNAATLEVMPGGSLASISEAVTLAANGDTIVVTGGVYLEHHIVVAKPLHLIGHNGAVIDADGQGGIFDIRAKSVTIEGFELRGVPTSFMAENAAILIEDSENITVRSNRIRNCFFAIYIANSLRCLIRDNDIEGAEERLTFSGNGVHLWYCREITVVGNTVHGHRDGIYMEFVRHSRLDSNVCSNNLRYGLHFMFSDSCRYQSNVFSHNTAGVAVMYTYNVKMYNNTFEHSWGGASYGMLLKDIKNSDVIGNRFQDNSVGIHIEGSDRIHISGNLFTDNGWAIKLMANCQENLIEGNDFLNNSFAVATNSRQNHSQFRGNYWSSYQGFDLDRDGFGDLPYRPVSLFSLMVESNPPTLVLLHSLLADVLDLAERVVPSLTPETLMDEQPSMRPLL